MSEAYLVVLEEKVRLAARRSRTDGRLAAQRRGQGHAEAAQEAMASGATAAGRLAGLGPSLFSRNRQTRFCPLRARGAATGAGLSSHEASMMSVVDVTVMGTLETKANTFSFPSKYGNASRSAN